ncbi:GntR family transcriptional regulator [Sphingopyxis sp. SE2]|jgi:DNA-binding GntR family transcriptional regulator|uniref:GntR family transcriptional regulator n=1 Tax=Sphingopyxis sp. SE2 TaxID=1586240 RepID=UPI0028C11704|nr:GntR family transcriptional regulator [Sphingopyxis sp. SE2]MDT7529074.1 GntR family transcriptional regulator [Sphingopyxis sp. SE2]
MSPGATMERVYIDLKVRIMTGAYPPGTRLDPRQLARAMDASATPVRDALHRLSGERIVDSWHQEGFRQPLLTEADLVDLYEWGGMLLALALKGRQPSPNLRAGLSELQKIEPYPEAVDSLFGVIAVGASNRELRYAIVNFVERSRAFRSAELRIDPASRVTLAAMEEDYRFGRWTALRSKITTFHRRRTRQAGRIAAAVRPRSDPLR